MDATNLFTKRVSKALLVYKHRFFQKSKSQVPTMAL